MQLQSRSDLLRPIWIHGNVNVHVAKHMKVCKMEELGESVVWREATGLVAIKTFLEAHQENYTRSSQEFQE